MADYELDSTPSRQPRALNGTMLPNNLVAVVIGLAFLPILLNGLGISFSAGPPARPPEAAAIRPQEVTRGACIHVLLEWTAFMIALATVVFALTHYFIAHDVTTPTISAALFFSGMIDAFQSLAAVRLLPFAMDPNTFLPFTWFVSRLVNVCFLIAGTLPFVWGHARSRRAPARDLRFLILAGVLYASMAY